MTGFYALFRRLSLRYAYREDIRPRQGRLMDVTFFYEYMTPTGSIVAYKLTTLQINAFTNQRLHRYPIARQP